MNETKLKTVAQISALLAGTADVVFATPANEAARRDFISGVLKRFVVVPCGLSNQCRPV